MSNITIRQYANHFAIDVPAATYHGFTPLGIELQAITAATECKPDGYKADSGERRLMVVAPSGRKVVDYPALVAALAAQEASKAAAAQQAATDRAEGFVPATPKQLDYLRLLGIKVEGERISKTQASMAIDLHKNGDGVGSVGLWYVSGGN